ncbi:hypothetical protein BDD12DRAFT_809888 [Trichophaea hybrida]|nr:hypothetical protein BDD12DRAFT_809888 [Trichophaea hybrida]
MLPRSIESNTEHPDNELRATLQHELIGAFPGRSKYDRASVLTLYWEEDDFEPPCKMEVGIVNELFRNDFHYETETFVIPSENSYNMLELALVDFKCRNDGLNNLLIVYYCGHGDESIDLQKAVWSAKGSGGPEVNWFRLQPTLQEARADVLLILDCCFATLAAKSGQLGRLSLLAAAPDNGKTPSPGPYSFTRFFVDEIRSVLQERRFVQLSELPSRIHQRSIQTPVLFNQRLLQLEPYGIEPNQTPCIAPAASFSFTISVSQPPTSETVRELGEYIKRIAPKSVSNVTVDRVVRTSTSLRDFVLGENKAGLPGRFLDSLASPDQRLLLEELREISALFARTKQWISPNPTEAHSRDAQPPTKVYEGALELLNDFERQAARLSDIVQGLVLSHPEFQTPTRLQQLENSEAAQNIGLSEAASLSLLNKTPESDPLPNPKLLPKGSVQYGRLTEPFRAGSSQGVYVIVELIHYAAETNAPPPEALKQQVERMCSRLMSPKSDFYRILPCKGLPLEKRYRIAYSVASALRQLHRVSWLHKGIRSDTILFFRRTGQMEGVDHDEPWLFGFEYSRSDAYLSELKAQFRLARTIYTPQLRWGRPMIPFTFAHDVYALGVLLLEIGYWKYILKMGNFQDALSQRKHEKS